MSLSKATKAWKSRYYLLLILFIAAVGVLGYFYGYSYLKQRAILGVEQEIQSQQETVDQLYQNSWFKEFLAIKELEKSRTHLPRSTYVNEILSILAKVKGVEEWRGNVVLSDFKVNLEELSLNGVVWNLKTLYTSSNGTASLLESFNTLEFLKDITIRKYERGTTTRGFAFTLSAKVVNDARTESTTHQ